MHSIFLRSSEGLLSGKSVGETVSLLAVDGEVCYNGASTAAAGKKWWRGSLPC